jgi:hypothetical protein
MIDTLKDNLKKRFGTAAQALGDLAGPDRAAAAELLRDETLFVHRRRQLGDCHFSEFSAYSRQRVLL